MTTGEELRIGDAERDETMAALREHYAQGRLTREELDERLDLALTARTAGDLSRVTADLPGEAYGRRQAEVYGYRATEAYGHREDHPYGYDVDAWRDAVTAHRRHVHQTRQAHRDLRRRMRRGGHPRGPWGRRGPGPLAPILLVALIAGLAVGGFSVLKVLFFV